jgi:hypothetical protein
MRLLRSLTGTEADVRAAAGVGVWDRPWTPTRHHVGLAHAGETLAVPVYEVDAGAPGEVVYVAAEEVSNGVWLFALLAR